MFESLDELTDQNKGFINVGLEFFSKRPVSTLYGLYLIGLFLLANNQFVMGLYSFDTVVVHAGILSLLILVEQKWIIKLQDKNTIYHYFLIRRSWKFFFLAGIMVGSLNAFIVPILEFISFDNSKPTSVLLFLSFILASNLHLLMLVPGFYKVMNDDPKTSEITRLVSSPAQITTFSIYLLAGISIPTLLFLEMSRFSLLYQLQSYSFSPTPIRSLNTNLQTFVFWKAEIFLVYLLPLILYRGGEIGSYLIKDGRIFIPGKKVLYIVGIKFAISGFLIGILLFLISYSTSSFLSHFVPLLFFGIVLLRMRVNQPYCTRCHFALFDKSKFMSNGACYNCDYHEETVLSLNIPTLRKTLVPQCPSCGRIWDEPTRQCSNCKYTLVLACPHCGDTLNPLWTNCARCKNPVIPIPNRALSTKGFMGFQKSIMNFLFFALLLGLTTIYFGISEIVILKIIRTGMPLNNPILEQKLVLYSILNGFVLIVCFFGVISAIILFSSSSGKNDFPIFLIASKIISLPIGIIFVYLLIGNLLLFPNFNVLSLMAKLFSLFVLVYYLLSKWKSLKEFTPLVSIDWEVIK